MARQKIITFPASSTLDPIVASPASLHSCAVKSVTYATASTLSMTGKNVLPYATLSYISPRKSKTYTSLSIIVTKSITPVASIMYIVSSLFTLFIRAASSTPVSASAAILMISMPFT